MSNWSGAAGRVLPVLLLAAGLLLPGLREAAADANWKGNSAIWQLADKCTRAAHKQYPDYTREANQKREAARQACMRASNLPVESGPATAQTPERAQSQR
jgi:hypothetical protein